MTKLQAKIYNDVVQEAVFVEQKFNLPKKKFLKRKISKIANLIHIDTSSLTISNDRFSNYGCNVQEDLKSNFKWVGYTVL